MSRPNLSMTEAGMSPGTGDPRLVRRPARRTRGRAAGSLVLGVLAVSFALLLPGATAAGADSDALAEVSRSTFRLVPGKARVDVVVELSLTNRKPSTVRTVPCPGAPSRTCRQQISYYGNEWGYLVIQAGARNLG